MKATLEEEKEVEEAEDLEERPGKFV